MPELPEVETVVRDLVRGGLVGRAIRSARVLWPRTLGGMPPLAFTRAVAGRRVQSVGRRAKYVILSLSDGATVLIHLRMSGRLWLSAAGSSDPHARLWLDLDDGRRLVFSDPRKFGRWLLTRTPGRVLDRIGPEPLSPGFTRARLGCALATRRRMLKPLLLDQSFLAGMGNIYVDESLWRAGLHPCRRSDSLTTAEVAALHRAIRAILRQAIRFNGTSLGDGRANFRGGDGRRGRNQDRLHVFRRTGAPCPRCGTPITRSVVAQRGTHVCSRCQPRPRFSRGISRESTL